MSKYPALNIGSKNILYKRLSANRKDEIQKNKKLIEYCNEHFDELWRDNSSSNPEKNKWVRDCTGSRLARLLSKIDRLLLKPLDKFLPDFVHGGISGKFQKNQVQYFLNVLKVLPFPLLMAKKVDGYCIWICKDFLNRFQKKK